MPDLSEFAHGTSAQRRAFACPEPVRALELAEDAAGNTLVAIGGDSRVTIGEFREDTTQEGGSALSALVFNTVISVRQQARVQALAWAPEAVTSQGPGQISYNFCSAGSDHQVNCYFGDSRQPSVQTLKGHTSYVNACAYDPSDSHRLATISDDRTCRLWDISAGQCIMQLSLSSAGMAVCWHPAEPLKLLVAERRGLLRVYDLMSQKPILSMETGQGPLLDADWCSSNNLLAGAVAGGSAFVWDMSRGSEPEELRVVHADGATRFRWCTVSDRMFATMGCPPHQIKVHALGSQKVPVSHSLPVAGGLSWFPRLPLFAVGGDQEIHVWECGF